MPKKETMSIGQFEKKWVSAIDETVEKLKPKYSSRCHFIKVAVDKLLKEENQETKGEQFGNY